MPVEHPTHPPGVSPLSVFARSAAPELLRFAYLLTGDRHRAEDLLQEVFLAMHRRFGGELPLDSPVGYARRALANHNISWARRASSSELTLDPGDRPERAGSDAHDDITSVAERDALWQALRRLPARQRTVLVLRFYADAADEDIAETLGCRRGTVRSLASRGLDALRSDRTLAPDTDGGAR